MSEKITLSGVPETMLQTVYARAKETKTRGAITDNKAVEIIDRLDYDFSMADKDAAMHSGVIARTIVLDKLVKTYLAGHGGAVVVNIACGLDTRSSFDIVLSLNGFHAFPDKEAAYRETFRVLKPGGTFCGCFYVSGECRRTDRLIKKVYEPMKFFTPPYETVQSLKVRLEGMYADVQLGNVKSIAWFVCRKAERAKKMEEGHHE